MTAIAAVSSLGFAAAPAPAAAAASRIPVCVSVRISAFSASQMTATRKYWTAGRLGAAARPGQAGRASFTPAAGAAARPGQEPVTSTLCVARPRPGQTSGAALAARLPAGAAAARTAGGTTSGPAGARPAGGTTSGPAGARPAGGTTSGPAGARPAGGTTSGPAGARPAGARTGATAFGGYPSVGELFQVNGTKLSPRCTAATISPPGGALNPRNLQSLILTSAHCVEAISRGVTQVAANLAFVPQFNRPGKVARPFGLWVVRAFVVDSRWSGCGSGCPRFDYAIGILQANGGSQLGRVVGANGWSISQPPTVRNATLVGYPSASTRPLLATTTVETVTKGGSRYRRADNTPSFSNGTSGAPFFASYNATTHVGTLFGDIGGYQQGGNFPSPSYSPYWTSAFAQLVAAAFTVEQQNLPAAGLSGRRRRPRPRPVPGS